MTKEMNIYQKVAVLQEKIVVQKSSINDFANFKYRTIQDILIILKPLLKELDLIVRFSSTTLSEDKLSLGIIIIDINNPDNAITEMGDIYSDRTKQKMDLSQKVLSAKTFLKKSLLEDLLLINEDDDPDSHDNGNTGKPKNNQSYNKANNNTAPKAEDTKDIKKLKNILYVAAGNDKDKMVDLLEQQTGFKGKDGKEVKGLRDFNKLTGKRLEVTLSKIEKLYPDIVKDIEKKLNK